jgi:preprotein translocase subunit YajC
VLFNSATLPCVLAFNIADLGMLPALIGIFILFYFFIIRAQHRERAKHDRMLRELKKNDRVLTIGGIYGVVANVQPDSNEVVIKVDEATNTKLHVTRNAIQQVIKDDEPASEKPKE